MRPLYALYAIAGAHQPTSGDKYLLVVFVWQGQLQVIVNFRLDYWSEKIVTLSLASGRRTDYCSPPR